MARTQVDELFVKAGVDLSSLTGGLREFERLTMTSAQRAVASLKTIDDGVGRLQKSFFTLKNAVIVGLAFEASRFVIGLLDSAGALADAADAAGLTITRFQELQKASLLSGVSADTFSGAMNRLAKTVGDAAAGNAEAIAKFDALGVGILDANGKIRSQDAILNDVIKTISSYGTQAERASASAGLFGREAGPKFAAFLGQGTKAIEDLVAQAHEMGLVLSESMVRQADAASDRLAVLADTIKTKLTLVLVKLAPVIDKVANAILFLLSVLSSDVNTSGGVAAELARVNNELDKLKEQKASPISSTLNSLMGFDTDKTIKELEDKRDALKALFFKFRKEESAPPEEDAGPTRNPLEKGERLGSLLDKFFNNDESAQKQAESRAIAAGQRAEAAREKSKAFMESWVKGFGEASQRQTLKFLQGPMEALADFEKRKVEALKNFQQATDEMAADRAVKVKDALDKIANDNERTASDVREAWSSAFEHIGQTMIQTLTDSSLTAWDKVKRIAFDALEQIARAAATQLGGGQDPYKQAGGWLADILGGLFGSSAAGSSTAMTATQFMGTAHFAEGGPIKAGQMALVGERGPELIVPSASGTVIPSGQTRALLGGGGDTTVINQSFSFNVGTGASEAAQVVRGLMPQIMAAAKSGVANDLRRNGDLRKQIG